jgi:hypothetical protein
MQFSKVEPVKSASIKLEPTKLVLRKPNHLKTPSQN